MLNPVTMDIIGIRSSRPVGHRLLQQLQALVGLLVLGGFSPARAAGTAAVCVPSDKPAQRLLVTVDHAWPVKGNITFTLYGSDPAAFLKHKGSIALTRVMLSSSQAVACFSLPAPGFYAVAVYHDANNNHRFDRTLFGLPAEGYGFSNNAPIELGPPAFKAVRFPVQAGDNRITIKLVY